MIELNFDRPAKPIAEFAGRPDFPHCAVGEFVDIGGFTGIVIEVVSNSIKVTAPEGFTRRFNHHKLREIYAPRVLREEPAQQKTPAVDEQREPASVPPAPSEIEHPNFDREAKPIQEFFGQPDYPKSLLGEMVDIGGYKGVVVSIENQSLKVRSRQGTSRKYNAALLAKLHGASPV